jgi:hypothetical protein
MTNEKEQITYALFTSGPLYVCLTKPTNPLYNNRQPTSRLLSGDLARLIRFVSMANHRAVMLVAWNEYHSIF